MNTSIVIYYQKDTKTKHGKCVNIFILMQKHKSSNSKCNDINRFHILGNKIKEILMNCHIPYETNVFK